MPRIDVLRGRPARYTGLNTEGYDAEGLARLNECYVGAVMAEEQRIGRELDPDDTADGSVLDALAERVGSGGEGALLTLCYGLAGE